MRRLTGDYPPAARALEEALGISRDLGDRLGQASALNVLGAVRQLTGDYPGAAEARRRRWASTATSATGSARPRAQTGWGPCGG